jgi:hypothetical protein
VSAGAIKGLLGPVEEGDVNGDLIAVLAGVVIGLAFAVSVVWPRRAEVIQGWRDWLGIEAKPAAPPDQRPLGKETRRRNRRTRWLTIAVCLLAIAGSIVVAVQTDDETVRLANIVAGGLLVLATAVLILDVPQRRPDGRGSKH